MPDEKVYFAVFTAEEGSLSSFTDFKRDVCVTPAVELRSFAEYKQYRGFEMFPRLQMLFRWPVNWYVKEFNLFQ